MRQNNEKKQITLAESDASKAVADMNSRSLLGLHGPIVSDICNLLFEHFCACLFSPRTGNRAAHSLARFGFKSKTTSFWTDMLPSWLSTSVRLD